jgi:ribonuclease HII
MPTQPWIAGVDEAGRGPLAGPVYAAAVILDPNQPIQGLKDSKKLSEKRREILFHDITEKSKAWAFAIATVDEIDRLNILQATFLAMQRAVAGLSFAPTRVLVDGSMTPKFAYPAEAIIQGDASVEAISAASIVAKVLRDRSMIELDQLYPVYGFAKHKAYGTAAHMAALKEHGPCPEHRRSFAPVAAALLL